jgi:hypothetical protein
MTSRVFKKKKKFEKTYKVFNTKKDFDMQQDHNFAFWADPSQATVMTGLQILAFQGNETAIDSLAPEERVALNDRFFEFVSDVVIDCDIEGTDFSTPEEAHRSFNDPSIDWEFMYAVLIRYFNHVLTEAEALKKTIEAIEKTLSSGANKKNEEEE